MLRVIIASILLIQPFSMYGETDEYDTIFFKPIGVDYSKYPGNNKMYIVGECEGMKGNQIVVFQNRPTFDFFETNEAYKQEQQALEQAIWKEILDNDEESIMVKGKWHKYNDRDVFLCHQILKMNKEPLISQ